MQNLYWDQNKYYTTAMAPPIRAFVGIVHANGSMIIILLPFQGINDHHTVGVSNIAFFLLLMNPVCLGLNCFGFSVRNFCHRNIASL